MKMYEEIKNYRKDYVYEQYTRIVNNFKDYDRITKVKMIEAVYSIYSDYNNIIDICTTRELKYLKMVLDNKLTIKDLLETNSSLKIPYLDSKYDFERGTLRNKFLLDYDYYKESYIPEEILDKVKLAVKNVNWKEKKRYDDLSELLVSYCKIQGVVLVDSVVMFASSITNIPEDVIFNYMLNNKLVNYYVFIISKNIPSFSDNKLIAIYQDYYDIYEDIEKQRVIQGLAGVKGIDFNYYKTLFYNDFDINNSKIKKFLDRLEELSFYHTPIIKMVREFAMLNIDRTELKETIKSIPALKNENLVDLFKIMDEAMDEMPSGALNGFTPNEVKKLTIKKNKITVEKTKTYIKQNNACLNRNDAKLFYKLYFALLEFTNKKYNINLNIKLYKQKGINPYEIEDIVNKFWENKDAITVEFCMINPYKFNNEELKIVSDFKKGIRNTFIIAKYELEYTAFMSEDKIYMVKGINDNIDNIIPYNKLPYITITSIIPFKDNLIYDGLLLSFNIDMGINFYDIIKKEYNTKMKYYHL